VDALADLHRRARRRLPLERDRQLQHSRRRPRHPSRATGNRASNPPSRHARSQRRPRPRVTRGAIGDPHRARANCRARNSRSTTSLSASTMTSVDAPASDQHGPPGDHHQPRAGFSHVQSQIIPPSAPLPGADVITLSDARSPARDQKERRVGPHASGLVLVGSRSAAARRLPRRRQPPARCPSRCDEFTASTT
jgi:hypothetical protein